jgi:hypothetical protein
MPDYDPYAQPTESDLPLVEKLRRQVVQHRVDDDPESRKAAPPAASTPSSVTPPLEPPVPQTSVTSRPPVLPNAGTIPDLANMGNKRRAADLTQQADAIAARDQAAMQPASLKQRILGGLLKAAPVAALAALGRGNYAAASGAARGEEKAAATGREDRQKSHQERLAEQVRLRGQAEQETQRGEQAVSAERLEQMRLQGQREREKPTVLQTAQGPMMYDPVSRQMTPVPGGSEKVAVQDKRNEGAQARLDQTEKFTTGRDAANQEFKLKFQARDANIKRELQQMRVAAAQNPNKVSPQILRQAQTAQTIIPQIERIKQETQQMAQSLGPFIGRWKDLMTERVGAPNPEFARYLSDVKYLDSAITLAHSQGRVSNLIFEHFKEMYDAGKQSPENMLAFLESGSTWMQAYADAPAQIRGAAPQAAPQGGTPPPPGGNARKVN